MHPGCAAQNGEQQTFGEELADQAAAPGSEADTQGDFLFARCRAGEQEASHVDGGNGEQHENGGEKREQCGADISDQTIAEWTHGMVMR